MPDKDVKLLKIIWPELPEDNSKWLAKPLSYLSHVIGHEGPNSLLSHLIKNGLVTALSCGNHNRLNN